MKIAQVSPYDYAYPSGVVDHIRHLVSEFQRVGHTVKIIAPSSSDQSEVQDNVYKIGGIVPVPFSGSIARISLSPRAYRTIKRILQQEQFDVIHIHEPLVPVMGPVVLRHSKTLNVGTFHAYRESDFAYYYGKPILQRFIGRVHGRICVSQSARQLVERYFPGEYTVIPNGIDPSRFAHPDVAPFPRWMDGRCNILIIGRFEKRKGHRYLLQAFPRVQRYFPDVRLIVAGGDGPQRDDCERMVAEMGLKNVEFYLDFPEEDKPRLLRSAHVFCAPSTGGESFGIVLLEAMSAGLPIVAGDIPGYRNVMTDGVEGFLVNPEDPAALSEALIRLLSDSDLRAKMGEAGRRQAPNYTWDKVARQVLDFYEETKRRMIRRQQLMSALTGQKKLSFHPSGGAS